MKVNFIIIKFGSNVRYSCHFYRKYITSSVKKSNVFSCAKKIQPGFCGSVFILKERTSPEEIRTVTIAKRFSWIALINAVLLFLSSPSRFAP